jgi:hypothetical protein
METSLTFVLVRLTPTSPPPATLFRVRACVVLAAVATAAVLVRRRIGTHSDARI